MTLPFENDTSIVIKKLSKRSLKSNTTRNTLTGMTIMLSVALLTGFILSVIGMQVNTDRELQSANHVLYRDIDTAQMEQLELDTRICDTLLMKQAPNTRIENFLVIPVYAEQKSSQIATEKIVEGHYPEQLYDVAVDKAYLRRLNLPEKVGEKITIPFYDGNTEIFTVVGLTDNGSTELAYSLYCSKEYAEHGSQLKNAVSLMAVQLTNASSMTKENFENTAWQMGADYGITRRNSDINETFSNSLMSNHEDILIVSLVSLAVFFVSYLVIYSIFYIYVQNQVREFGQLRTIGATAKQIRKLVRLQGKKLWIVGTLAGLPVGYLIAYIFKPDGWDWLNTAVASAFVLLLSYIVVLLSIQKPAKFASRVSPIDAMSNSEDCGSNVVKSKKLHRRITPLSLAFLNTVRNRRKSTITILSLGVAGIMFMAGTTLISSLDMERFARQGVLEYGEFSIELSRNAEKNDPHGQVGIQSNNPLSNDFICNIKDISGIAEITALQTLEIQYSYHGVQERNSFSPFSETNQELLEKYLLNGSIDYEQMCSNNEIILMRNEYSQTVHGWKFKVGDMVNIKWYNGAEYQEAEYKIAGEISDGIFQSQDGGKDFAKVQYFVMPDRLLEQMMIPGFNLNSDVIISIAADANEPAVRKQLSKIVADTPNTTIDTLHDAYQESASMYQRTETVIWGIGGFAMLFAVVNLINTLIANIISRKHEFSILRSVGMGKRQLHKAIQYEGLLLAFWNSLITLVCGGAIGYGIVRYLNYLGDDKWIWQFPIGYFVCYIIVAVLLPILISYILIQIMNKDTLVEQLRKSN